MLIFPLHPPKTSQIPQLPVQKERQKRNGGDQEQVRVRETNFEAAEQYKEYKEKGFHLVRLN